MHIPKFLRQTAFRSMWILSISAIAFTACSDDDDDDNPTPTDTTAPVVQLSDPTNDETFEPGETIHLEGTVTDESGLSQLKVDIHWAGDGHDHGGKRSNEWEYEQIWPISGLTWTFHEDIEIPMDADSGEYHVIVFALDAAGNQAQFVQRDIVISDDHGHGSTDTENPTLNLTSPTHTSRQMIMAGATIQIQGMVSDNDHLDEIHIEMINEATNAEVAHIHLGHNDLDDHDQHTLNETITVPSVTQHTDMKLKIEVTDEAGNKVEQEFLYHVDP